MTRPQKSDRGYVALEFALGIGLLVLPTSLILLQIPRVLEQNDRVKNVAAEVARACANKASTYSEAQEIAQTVAQEEMIYSIVLSKASLIAASCSSSSSEIVAGETITSTVSIEVESILITGLPTSRKWTVTKTHQFIVPNYRSFEE